jgi:sortase A
VALVFYRILGAVGRVLIVAGVLILLFVAFQLWGTGLEQSGHQDELGTELAREVVPDNSKAAKADPLDAVVSQFAEVDPATAPPMEPPPAGTAFGVIEIERIGLRQFIVAGVSKEDLKKGPGHYPTTPLPGQPGNSAIAGHRTTYGAPFNRIDELRPGDPIYVSTSQGRFRYEVIPPPEGVGIERGAGWFSVRPTQTEVIAPTDDNRLTLTACHPKRSAKQRIIVVARLANEPAAAPVESPTPETPKLDTRPVVDIEETFSGDPAAKWPALGLGAAAGAVWLGAWWIGRRFGRKWLVYGLATPGFLVVLWFCFVYTDRWLPSF